MERGTNDTLLRDLRSWTANTVATTGVIDAWARVDALIDTARDGHVRYEPGDPLIIDGVDCSPENVRSLEKLLNTYRGIVLGREELA